VTNVGALPRRPPTPLTDHYGAESLAARGTEAPILVCLLGSFRLLKRGKPVPLHGGGKMESLLCALGLRGDRGIPREQLLQTLWPDGADLALAGQSLNSLVYSLHRLLRDGSGGAKPVVSGDGNYRLNFEAGIGLDILSFETLAAAGDQHDRAGDEVAASGAYARAVALYRGDLCVGTDLAAVVERERLRALYLRLLVRLAEANYRAGDFTACLDYAQRLLASDPVREDAHRLAMLCHLRLGQRAQALRQYRLCEHALRAEFDAEPEPATRELFDILRLDPGRL
jgi:DNA-binding SARP family transcriptional activator